MKSEKIRLVNPTYFHNSVRSRFFEIVRSIQPNVFNDLKENALPLFLESGMSEQLDPFSKLIVIWDDFENGNNLQPATKKLREYLAEWQLKWGLVEKNQTEKWILRWVIYGVLSYWARSSNHVKNRYIFESLNNFQELDLDAIIVFDAPPKCQPAEFVEFDKISNLETIKKTQAEYINGILDNYKRKLESYCKKIEKTVREKGWKSEIEIKDRDLLWTAESQVKDLTYSEIADLGKIELKKRRRAIKLSDFNFDDLKIDPVEVSTVKRAVEKTLNILNLKQRKKKIGRQPGKYSIVKKRQRLE